ncbi:MAG: hypothetical protein V7727_19465 [Sneathiella sp.]
MSSKKSTLQKLCDRLLIEFPDYPREISRVDIKTGKQLSEELLALSELIKATDFGLDFDIAISNITELSNKADEEKAIVSINVKGVNRRPIIEIETRTNFLSAASDQSFSEQFEGSDFRSVLEPLYNLYVDGLRQIGRPYTETFIKIKFDGKERFICEKDEISAFNERWGECKSKGSLARRDFVGDYLGEPVTDVNVRLSSFTQEANEFEIGSFENLTYRMVDILFDIIRKPIDESNVHKIFEAGRIFELLKELKFERKRIENRTASSGGASKRNRNARIEALLSGVEGELANNNRSHFTENLFDAYARDELEKGLISIPNLWKQGANQFDNYLSEIKSKEPWRCRYLAILGKSA